MVWVEASNAGQRITNDVTLDFELGRSRAMGQITAAAASGMGGTTRFTPIGRRIEYLDDLSPCEGLLRSGESDTHRLTGKAPVGEHHAPRRFFANRRTSIGGPVKRQPINPTELTLSNARP